MAAVFRRHQFKKNKQNLWARTSLQNSIKGVIILAQIFALMPVTGITSKDVNKIQFKRFSLRMIYCFFNILGSSGLAIMNFFRFLKTGMHFGDFGKNIFLSPFFYSITLFLVSVLFYLSGVSSMLLFIKIASDWLVLSKKWFDVEKSMHKYEYQPNLRKRFVLTTIIVMFLALGNKNNLKSTLF